MNFKRATNKKEEVLFTVQSSEVSATIPLGTPSVLALNGVADGLAIVLPSTAGATLAGYAHIGVCLGNLTPNQYGVSHVSGFTRYALAVVNTRAATTNNWAAATVAQGAQLGIDTVNNAYMTGGTLPVWAAGTLNTFASAASNATDTRTASVAGISVLVRNM